VYAVGRKQVLSSLLGTLFFLNTIYLLDAYHLIRKVMEKFMSKGRDSKKSAKKKPEKTLKEKRKEKKIKKLNK
jgi:hypothetical protein